MIELRNFTIGYGQRTLLNDVNACFEKGKLTALIGRNGSGKSTLLRAIAGLNPNYSGEIYLSGIESKKLSAEKRAKTLAFVSTMRVRIPNMKCRDVVSIGRAPYTDWIGKMNSSDKKIVEESLEAVGMASFADRTMDSMSDGESQRIMIARALAQSTPTILLDEPTSFLDLPNRYELCSLLAEIAHKENKCILFSTHELDIVMSICDNVALIDSPSLIVGPVDEVVAGGAIQKLFSSDKMTIDPLRFLHKAKE